MSDCGVCIGSEPDGYVEFYDCKTVKARKTHRCCECGTLIPVGTEYRRASGKYEGEVFTEKTCMICDEIRGAFSCESVTFGELWSEMSEVFDELTTSCFDRLKTPEAKREVQRRWMKWKGLTGEEA